MRGKQKDRREDRKDNRGMKEVKSRWLSKSRILLDFTARRKIIQKLKAHFLIHA